MKANENQIPSKVEKKLSDTHVKPVNSGSAWAHIRRIEARLDSIEQRTSTVRRDCDRIEKKLSRDDAKLLPSVNADQPAGIPADILELIGGV